MKLLFLCIGSEKISGDSIGPIVGSLLKTKYNLPYPVLGTEEKPVNGINLPHYMENIRNCFPEHKIIAIDSAVGDKKDLWTIKIKKGGVVAGGAVNSNNPRIGDIGILAVVGEKSKDVLSTLLQSPLEKVEELAEYIAMLINNVFSPSVKNSELKSVISV